MDLQNFVGGAVQPVTLATMYKDKYMYAYFNMAYAEFEQTPPVTNPLVSKDSALALTVINAADTSRYWKGELDYTSPNVDLQTGTVTVTGHSRKSERRIIKRDVCQNPASL